jgi:hypothetical protein
MENAQWKVFFLIAARILGPGDNVAFKSESWCSWTTFQRLKIDSGYWTFGLPRPNEIAEDHIKDSGVWGQPFPFSELAHIILPREFLRETPPGERPYRCEFKEQDLETLSRELERTGIVHRKTDLILEIKLY